MYSKADNNFRGEWIFYDHVNDFIANSLPYMLKNFENQSIKKCLEVTKIWWLTSFRQLDPMYFKRPHDKSKRT